jgi:hypothetical protein
MHSKVAGSVIFTVEQHIRGWRKAREFTATGPSGLTFSHFIAATHDPLLTSFDATMANIPYATGYSPKRWQLGTDVIIPKSTASLDANKLGTLLLLDPEFNHNNKILGHALMSHAEAFDQMPAEQYGSRKKHRAIEAGCTQQIPHTRYLAPETSGWRTLLQRREVLLRPSSSLIRNPLHAAPWLPTWPHSLYVCHLAENAALHSTTAIFLSKV